MSERRRTALRLSLGLALVLLGLLEVQSFVEVLGGQNRLRDRVFLTIRNSIANARPRLGRLMSGGDEAAWAAAIREALDNALATEAEVFDASGRRLQVAPSRPSPIRHWPERGELLALRAGAVVTAGPFLAGSSRLLTYIAFPSGGDVVILRLSTSVPELVDDLRERRQLFVGHGIALVLLVLAGSLALFPGPSPEPTAGPHALGAYEAAMARLRERGQEISERHEAERRRLEEMLHDTQALARAGELTAGIVHEVRNGLATILGYARLIEAGAPGGSEAARSIREECETLEGVARRFMDFVRRETLKLEAFDLRRLLSRAVARESRARSVAEVRLSSGEPLSLTGDEELLERAFENLVRNALEAAGPAGHVAVDVARAADRARVTISDDGPGLPEGGAGHRPFFTTKPGGLGLGLPIAFKIASLHEGTLEFHPRVPHGLLVTVSLPLAGPAPGASVVTSGSSQ